ncbi:MAG: hypothetical protein GY933_05575 [Hyphomicrobiales bacterium]|nr:hypothetical protein [Hyphomicrobiales bacterium]
MKRAILTLCIVMVTFPALAINRYDVKSMSCAAVQQTVNREGAAILRWQSTRNPSLPLYNRYVKNGFYCNAGEYAKSAYVPTRDNPNCRVRECEDIDFDDGILVR